MRMQPRGRARAQHRLSIQRWLEGGVFLLASLLGIYGIGQGLAGLYEQGKEINLLWLAVTGIAFYILFAQMGRVHDSWPHRPKANTVPAPGEGSPDANGK
jgi:hypothetical protein